MKDITQTKAHEEIMELHYEPNGRVVGYYRGIDHIGIDRTEVVE